MARLVLALLAVPARTIQLHNSWSAVDELQDNMSFSDLNKISGSDTYNMSASDTYNMSSNGTIDMGCNEGFNDIYNMSSNDTQNSSSNSSSNSSTSVFRAPCFKPEPQKPQDDPCVCLDWKEIYPGVNRASDFQPYADCGDAYELFPHVHNLEQNREPIWQPQTEFCAWFFKRLKGRFCLNVAEDDAPAEWYGGGWCYVKPECEIATVPKNGTTGTAKVKLCQKGTDKFLSDYTPMQLYDMSKAQELDMSLLTKMAYPVERALDSTNASVARLDSFYKRGMPVVVDSETGHPPFEIQQGDSQYEILDNMAHRQADRISTNTKFKCVYGCNLSNLSGGL